MIRRGIGVVMILVGLTGVVASFVGARLGHRAVEAVGNDMDASLVLLSQSLEVVGDSLSTAKDSLAAVSEGLENLEQALLNLGVTIDETQPLLLELRGIVSEDVPESVEAMQEAFPGMSQVAGVIDDTLTTLNRFRIDEEILGFRIHYDLGIDYDPSMPFNESVDTIGRSLDGLPDRLRGLSSHVETTGDNLEIIGQDVTGLATNIDTINDRIDEIDPLIDEYSRIVTDVNDNARRVRRNLAEQVAEAKLVVTMLMVWLGLSQIAPLFLGWELALSRRPE